MSVIRKKDKCPDRKGEGKQVKKKTGSEGCYTLTRRQAEVKNSYTVALVYSIICCDHPRGIQTHEPLSFSTET